MESHPQVIVGLEEIQKWKVAVVVGLLENTIEIADRLMIVQCQTEANRCGHDRPEVSGAAAIQWSRKRAAASSGASGLMWHPEPHSKPADRVNRGKISICQ
jgi:hypothetical protein